MSVRRLTVRIAWSVVTLLTLLVALHLVTFAMPGDPVRTLFGLRAPAPELLAELRAAYGLDDPYVHQLGRYLGGLLGGDFGPVYRLSPDGLSATGDSVNEVVWRALPSTLSIIGLALVLQTVIGTVLAARLGETRGGTRRLWTAVVSILIAVPSFVFATAFKSYAPTAVEFANTLVAACCIAALPAGLIALVHHAEIRGTRRSAFARTAVASGLPPNRIRWRHALRPTLATILTQSAAELGGLFAGAILVEPILERPGVGALLVQALETRQGPIVLAVVSFYLIAVTLVNLFADVMTSVLDPRISAV